MHGFNGMGWGMGFGWLFFPVILVAIIWVIVKIVHQNNNQNQPKDKSALDILKENYARGNISRENSIRKKKIYYRSF